MKKIVFLLIFVFICAQVALALPPEMVTINQLEKINKNAEKRFHYEENKRKSGKYKTISIWGLTKPSPGKPEDAAEAFLKENHKLFNLSENLSELKRVKVASSFKGTRVEYEQYYQGIPIFLPRGITIEMDKNNRIQMAAGGIIPIENFNIMPGIKQEELQDILKINKPEIDAITDSKLVIYILADDEPVLAYDVFTKNYHLMVDASTGRIIADFIRYWN